MPTSWLCKAMRLRSRQVSWRMGSIPFCIRIEAATVESRWARALAPSVTLTASARPFIDAARSIRSFGSAESGGVTSAVITKVLDWSLVLRVT